MCVYCLRRFVRDISQPYFLLSSLHFLAELKVDGCMIFFLLFVQVRETNKRIVFLIFEVLPCKLSLKNLH